MLVGSSVESSREAAIVRLGREAHVVEHEELGLRAEHRPCRRCRSAADRPRPSWRWRAGRAHRARRSSGSSTSQNTISVRLREERIDHRRVAVGHQLHVGLVDRLPAGDRGAVEHDAVGEGVLVHRVRTSMVTCCILPRGSVKRRSTNLMSSSLIFFSDALCVCHCHSPVIRD